MIPWSKGLPTDPTVHVIVCNTVAQPTKGAPHRLAKVWLLVNRDGRTGSVMSVSCVYFPESVYCVCVSLNQCIVCVFPFIIVLCMCFPESVYRVCISLHPGLMNLMRAFHGFRIY